MRSLSGRLLILTVIFVMLAEILIFVPSLARYREGYLRERLVTANIVAIALQEQDSIESLYYPTDFQTPEPDDRIEKQLLESAKVRSIALRFDDGRRSPVLRGYADDVVSASYEIDEHSVFRLIGDALMALISPQPDRVIHVVGAVDETNNPISAQVEVTLNEKQLLEAMVAFAGRILILSLVISLLTAALVFLSLNRWLVRPIRRLIEAMTDFRQAPEAAAILTATGGQTEIDEAERELAAMQTDVRAALKQKNRLASLGEAVAKINHDLRNMLASAQLLADRLERSDDPLVVRTAPKLLRSLDRATALCTQTLTFGKAEEPAPVRRRVRLSTLLSEVRDTVVPDEASPVDVVADISHDVFAEADPDQLFRILQNLMRNAEQAMTASGKGKLITVTAQRSDNGVEIDITDDGPGMPLAAKENLFTAFKGGVRKGGTGLGLNIARELARGHGGDVALLDSTSDGTRFRVTIPDMAA